MRSPAMIRAASFPVDREVVQGLLREYAESLGIPLDFQQFDDEVATLPGAYAPPDGTILLAMHDDVAAGIVALRKFEDRIAEMKRLFVRPDARGLGIGETLVRAIVDEARTRGYRAIRLDTLPTMRAAIALYESLGFREIAPYRFNPVEGTKFFELDLS